jgi:hypothetical protein
LLKTITLKTAVDTDKSGYFSGYQFTKKKKALFQIYTPLSYVNPILQRPTALSRITALFAVIPALAGIQGLKFLLDARFHGA